MERIEAILHNRSVQVAFLLMSGIGCVLGCGWWIYSHYVATRNRDAQLIFAEHFEQYERMRINPEATSDMWSLIEQGFERGYYSYRSASLAPYFLAFQADAAMRAGNGEQACALLAEALPRMTHVPHLYYLYAIKLASWRLDMPQSEVREQGKRDMLIYAQDIRNPHQGLAWYHAWVYAWLSRDGDLYELARTKLKSFSEWEQLMREKLGSDGSEYEL